MQKRLFLLPLLLLICLFTTYPASADAASIKERMAARIPTINNLKDAGTIGENNQGYLEFRSGSKSGQDVVNAENTDRKKVYGAIAKKEGVQQSLVGQRRAKMISSKGKKGHWFQGADGKWYRK